MQPQTSILKRVTSILLAALMLISTIGISVDIHYCGGKIKSVGIFAPAEKCKAEMQETGCKPEVEKGIQSTPCCANKQFFCQVSGLDEVITHQPNIQLTHKIVPLISQSFHLESCVLEDKKPNRGLDPPLIATQIFQVYEQYLI